MELLTACMKLFFARPGEMQSILGRLLEAAVNDTHDQEIHDKALLYYRLLEYDVATAMRVVAPSLPPLDCFIEEVDADVRQRLYQEFNTLSVVFGKPSEQFISADFLKKGAEEEEEEEEQEEGGGEGEEGGDAGGYDDYGGAGEEQQQQPPPAQDQEQVAPAPDAYAQQPAPAPAPAPVPAPAPPVMNLLDMDDLMMGGPAPAPAPAPAPPPGLELVPNCNLDSGTFQVVIGDITRTYLGSAGVEVE